eukprot:Nitzschia sp. Nitz4//scaffold52_size167869//58145//59869//NITZ4_002271-RA/size167869-processed-gene-0.159-mRNA-1//-1//CDS//3329554020//3735//frame0
MNILLLLFSLFLFCGLSRADQDSWNTTDVDWNIPPTGVPSVSPSQEILVATESAQLNLRLVSTPSVLEGVSEEVFLSATASFLKTQLDQSDYDITLQEVTIIMQAVEDRRRKLRMLEDANWPLNILLQVVASRTYTLGGEEFDWQALLQTTLQDNGDEFVALLRQEDEEAFFVSLDSVEVIVAPVATTNPTATPTTTSPTKLPTSSPTVSPTMAPTDSPTTAPTITTDTSINGINNTPDDGSSFSTGLIIGIAAAGVALLVLLFVAMRLAKGMDPDSKAVPEPKKSPAAPSPVQPASSSNNLLRSYSSASSKARPLSDQASDVESVGLYSYARTDNDSLMGGSHRPGSLANMDTMSYAYSLEPGLENSVMEGYSTDSRPVPMEIPQITVMPRAHAQSDYSLDGTMSAAGSERDFGIESTLGGGVHDNSVLVSTPSDLRLTESELAMLPSNLRDDETAYTNDVVTKEVLAPPGKLGLVIDTTVEGPVVHRVNDGSALKGQVNPGDIIVSIDNVDTKAMSASAITNLMVKTANKQRKLVLVDNSRNK